MTDTEINVAIAKECGWMWDFNGNGEVYWMCKEHPFRSFATPPNYCSNLNAMNEAEGKQPSSFWKKYVQALEAVIDRDHSEIELRYFINATARQRAEAFLRTVGKWTE